VGEPRVAPESSNDRRHTASRQTVWQLISVVALTLLTPAIISVANARHGGAAAIPSYLPALEGPRARKPFDPVPIEELTRMNPGYVVIGDSMAGTRIDPARLAALARRPVAPLLHPASGSVRWYFVLKNWVVPSRIHPRCVFIFFRDTNLTRALWRTDGWMLDPVAHEREDEVNTVIASAVEGPWHRLDATVEELYGADRARLWMEPVLTEAFGRTLIPSRRRRTEFLAEMNARLEGDHLRPMDAADLQIVEDRDADFTRDVRRSVLPLMLREAKAAGLTLCFVRVQRRPIGNRPPYQSPAMRRYIRELKDYIESNGALWRDDTGDPALTLDMYGDGDHVSRSARAFYTELFFARLRPLFP
jgi:hypothetical protein